VQGGLRIHVKASCFLAESPSIAFLACSSQASVGVTKLAGWMVGQISEAWGACRLRGTVVHAGTGGWRRGRSGKGGGGEREVGKRLVGLGAPPPGGCCVGRWRWPLQAMLPCVKHEDDRWLYELHSLPAPHNIMIPEHHDNILSGTDGMLMYGMYNGCSCLLLH
jgi:hypothetical protein